MANIAYVNGEFIPTGYANISINDRGLQFGDAVYEAVSYTHLDVYKRQGLGLAIVARFFEEHKGSIKLTDRIDGQRGAAVIPVSYTHLDVYKRQF